MHYNSQKISLNVRLKKLNNFFSSLKILEAIVFAVSLLFIALSILIVCQLTYKTAQFFLNVPFENFFLSITWNPISQGKQSFGFLPVLYGTILITLIAVVIAAPLGILSAIFVTEILPKSLRQIIVSFIEIVSGIPTIIYGFFAVIIIAPKVKDFATICGFENSLENALTAGIAMGIMITPFICSLSIQLFLELPKHYKESARALGSSLGETVLFVILPCAKHHLLSIFLLAISRSVGETMIVTMSAGNTPKITTNVFESVSTITTQIVTILSGDQEFDSPETLAVFTLALSLFLFTLLINYLSEQLKKTY